MRLSRRQALSLGALLFSGCTTRVRSKSLPPSENTWKTPTTDPRTVEVKPTTLVTNLEIPWDMDFMPDGDIFLTERVGRVRRYSAGEVETVIEPAAAIDASSLSPGSDERPWWVHGGEGGTMGIAVDPRYPDFPYIYVHFTAKFGSEQENRIVRYNVDVADPQATATPVVTGIPLRDTDAYIHRGGRLTIGPDDHLWATTGDGGFGYADSDRTGGYKSQDVSSMAGKLLRFTLEGEGVPENPDLGPDADPRIVTYGHRNPQGIDWLPDGTPISVEHGVSKDEINLITPGDDYGWPDVYSSLEHMFHPNVHQPIVNTGWGRTASGEKRFTTWAPSGCTFYTGNSIPAWHNRLLVAGLVSQQVIIVTLNRPDEDKPPLGDTGLRFDAGWLDTDEYVATTHPVLKDTLGRVRHVAQGPEGALYAITSNRDGRATGKFPREIDDVLVRLDPE